MSHSLLKFDDSPKAFVDSLYVFSVTVRRVLTVGNVSDAMGNMLPVYHFWNHRAATSSEQANGVRGGKKGATRADHFDELFRRCRPATQRLPKPVTVVMRILHGFGNVNLFSG